MCNNYPDYPWQIAKLMRESLSQMRHSLALPLLGFALAVVAPAPSRALTTVCTAAWTSSVPAGGTASGALSGAATPPCPSPSVTASVTVGTGANAGNRNTSDAIGGSATSNFARTSNESMDIGVVGTNGNYSRTLTFSQAVTNPYLFFTFTDLGTSFTFTQAFTLAQANNATRSGSTVTATGGTNSANDGFVVQMLGTYSTINFTYNNTSGFDQSVAFTAGANQVPGPLPLMGAGVAFGFSRRLRRRIKA